MQDWEIIRNKYIDRLKIFPIKENSKLPLVSKWNIDCSFDFFQIAYWINNSKNCNWGLPCKENDLFVLDLDVHDMDKNGITNFDKLIKDLGLDIKSIYNSNLVQKTPSGGYHIIFKSDNDLKQIKGIANAFSEYPGIDLRNSNYIVVEPSVINGHEYRFLNNNEPQEMPEKLKKFILDNSEKKGTNKGPYVKPKIVAVGSRDEQLFGYINNLYFKTNLDYDEILLLANHFNEEILEEPFSEKTIRQKVDYAFKKDRGERIVLRLGGMESEEKRND